MIIHLIQLYYEYFGYKPAEIIKLKGDGSDRQIYRMYGHEKPVIGIIGVNPAENNAFIGYSKHFKSFALNVPDILAFNKEFGIYLETDLGDVTLLSQIQSLKGQDDTIVAIYKSVVEILPCFQITAGNSIDYNLCYQYPEFGYENIRFDFDYFINRFVKMFYKGSVHINNIYKDFEIFVKVLLDTNTSYFLYRDFQSRNIMLVNNVPWFIDYQSGRRGALQYDIASLLYDAKANLSENARELILEHYINQLELMIKIDRNDFKYYFTAYSWIRIMQALGAYGYLSLVKGKTDFAHNIPLAINNIRTLLQKNSVITNLPALSDLLLQLTEKENLKNYREHE